jgi:acetyltransferase
MPAAVHPRITRLPDGRAVLVRAARPADAPAVQAFVRWLSPLARRRRFLGALSELSPAQLDRLTRVPDPRELSLLALAGSAKGAPVVAMAQYALDDPSSAEFALVVADAWQGQGLGERLLERLLERAAAAGVRTMGGFVLAENAPMRALATKLGFDCAPDRDPQLVRVQKRLPPSARTAWVGERMRRFVASLGVLPAMAQTRG